MLKANYFFVELCDIVKYIGEFIYFGHHKFTSNITREHKESKYLLLEGVSIETRPVFKINKWKEKLMFFIRNTLIYTYINTYITS